MRSRFFPFLDPLLASTAGWRRTLRPGGTAPFCFRSAALHVSGSPRKDPAEVLALSLRRLSGSPAKSRSLTWGAGTTCFEVPREQQGEKRRFRRKRCRAEVHQERDGRCGLLSCHPEILEEPPWRLRFTHRMASLPGLGQALEVRERSQEGCPRSS
jgi:hypothetical protein